MGIYDRDYMRRDDGGRDDGEIEDRVAGRLVDFLQRHPRLPIIIVGILIAMVAAIAILVVASHTR